MRATLASLFFCFSGILTAQSLLPFPNYWLKVNEDTSYTLWFNAVGDSSFATSVSGITPKWGYINFNPALTMDSLWQGYVMRIDSLSEAISILTAHQLDKTINEQGLWKLVLSAERSYTLSSLGFWPDTHRLDFPDTLFPEPLVSASFIGIGHCDLDSTAPHLNFTGSDSLHFQGKFAELIIFDHRLTKRTSLIWQSYLGIKFAVSLDNTDYLSSSGDTIWSREVAQEYRQDIAGLGKDSLLGLDQKQSHSYYDILSLATGEFAVTNALNTNTLPEGNYIMWAHNGGSAEQFTDGFLWGFAEVKPLNRIWQVTLSGDSADKVSTSLVVKGRNLPTDSLEATRMLIDKKGTGKLNPFMTFILAPDSIDTDSNLYFNNLYWDTDRSGKDRFTFLVYCEDSSFYLSKNDFGIANPSAVPDTDPEQEDQGQVSLYPNPSNGQFTIDMHFPRTTKVDLKIIDNMGRLVIQESMDGRAEYQYLGMLRTPGLYRAVLTTDQLLKEMDLIIR